jgi:hypothetical protein
MKHSMALNKLPFKQLQSLIGSHLSTKESPDTQKLVDELSSVRQRGYLTKSELVKVCRWKSSRAIQQIRRNREAAVRRITKNAFKTRSERRKLELLTNLHGVGVPMASAILMLTNPKRYGVIDIRVWQLLFTMGSVSENPNGTGFVFGQWRRFLIIIRYFARKYDVAARDIERTLFRAHELHQKGNLYGNLRPRHARK